HYLGLHDKPIGVLDSEGFYAPLLAFLDGTVERGFLNARTRAELLDAAEPRELIERVEARLAEA
ncbi:MAG: LOG family protein, partial [Halomonas sp.]